MEAPFWVVGRQEHHSMRAEYFSFRKEETGPSYIVYVERMPKQDRVAYNKNVGYIYQKYLKHILKSVLYNCF